MNRNPADTPKPPLTLGVLGGSFNPIHLGHLSIAQRVMMATRMERVLIIPAHTPPHKIGREEMAPPDDRLQMCQLAVENLRGLEVCDMEIRRGGVSYSVDTALALRAQYGPAASLRLIIGSDTLVELPSWRRIEDLLTLLGFAIVARKGQPLNEEAWHAIGKRLGGKAEEEMRRSVVEIERTDISSTAIRQYLRDGLSLPRWLRHDVEAYIRRKGLYGARPES